MNIGETVEIKNYGLTLSDFYAVEDFNARRNRRTKWVLTMTRLQGSKGKIVKTCEENIYIPASKHKLYEIEFSNKECWWFYEDDIVKSTNEDLE